MLYLRVLLQDLEEWCSTSTDRDFKTVSDRVEHEGLSFLTITLPNFCKDFEQALALGSVAPSHFAGFSRDGCLPRFLGGFTERVFDRKTGVLLDLPDVGSVSAVRQITLSFGKLKIACSEERVKGAFKQYFECERELERDLEAIGPPMWERFRRLAARLWSDVGHDVLRSFLNGDFEPQHGPGSTADSIIGNDKWKFVSWPERLDREFDFVSCLAPNSRWVSHLDDVEFPEPGDELPVKVVHVPKTLKTPRIIAMEPCSTMFVQQGLYKLLSGAIHRDDILRSFIGWESAEPNQLCARLGSLTGSLATLDLSEASDRVSTLHVQHLFGRHHRLTRLIMAARTPKAEVPGYGIIPLTKYASMGSALTFPLEAMVFLTIVFFGIEESLNTRLTRDEMLSYRGSVRVYGDDIIVPVDHVVSVMKALRQFGFRVNTTKSFWTGKFRESCGKEYYDGSDVSVVRVRYLFPSDRRQTRELESIVSLRNQHYYAGNWRVVRWLDHYIERLIPFPVVAPTARVLGRNSFLGYEVQKEDKDLQTPLVKGACILSPIPASVLDGVYALHKTLSTATGLPNPDERHLERAGRPRSSYTKVGMYRPY